MDSNEFSSFFWGLSDEHSNDQIMHSAESIVNLVETKQKFENEGRDFSKEKYKLYLNLCLHPTEDILYSMRRLVIKF
jgi:hypothetical protein